MHIEILVKEVREQKGMTISGLSRKSGVSVAHISEMVMLEKYNQSMQALQLYMNITRIIPSEKEWNRFAMEEKLLSSQSIQYFSQSGFNKLCRKLIKIR